MVKATLQRGIRGSRHGDALRWRRVLARSDHETRRPRHGAVRLGFVLLSLLLTLALAGRARAAQPPVALGTAEGFALLAGATLTNTGPSVISGDLGLSPGSAVTGFPPGTLNGAAHVTDAVALQAQSDLAIAYTDAAGRSSTQTISAGLGGRTLGPGVYSSGSSLGLTGDLVLDARGDPQAVFVFQAGSTLTTAAASRVRLINGAQECNVFWQVGSSATLGTSSVFRGTILALTSISATTGATIHGRLLARNGAVTLDTNTITKPLCAQASGPTTPPSGPGGATPTPGGPTPGPAGPTPAPAGPTPAPAGPTPAPGAPTAGPGGPSAGPSGPVGAPGAPAPPTVAARPLLSLGVSAPGKVGAGELLALGVLVRNRGLAPARNLVLSMPIPAGLALIGLPGATLRSGRLMISLGTLAPKTDRRLQIRLRASRQARGRRALDTVLRFRGAPPLAASTALRIVSGPPAGLPPVTG
jgi:uncharacterized repeat protein (TIGR01451 family)